jgi:hypothetical protein
MLPNAQGASVTWLFTAGLSSFHLFGGVSRVVWCRLSDLVARVRNAPSTVPLGLASASANFMLCVRRSFVGPALAEAVVAMLAVTSIGAIWCGVSPDLGKKVVVDR